MTATKEPSLTPDITSPTIARKLRRSPFAVVDLYKSGEIDAIFIRWLGAFGRPGALLNAMFYLNTLPE